MHVVRSEEGFSPLPELCTGGSSLVGLDFREGQTGLSIDDKSPPAIPLGNPLGLTAKLIAQSPSDARCSSSRRATRAG